MKPIHLSVISPTYQNEKYIKQTIEEIYNDIVDKASFKSEVIIAEDGSTDNTRNILIKLQKKYHFKLIADSKRKGHIKATKELYQKAKGKYIFHLDSDGECIPKDFWKLYKKLKETNADLVTGIRQNRRPIYRLIISKIQDIIAQLLFNIKAKDVNCPLKIVKADLGKKIVSKAGKLKYNFNLEQLILAQKRGIKFTQTKIAHRPRKSIISPPRKLIQQIYPAAMELIKFRNIHGN